MSGKSFIARQSVKDLAVATAVLAGTAVVLFGLWKVKQGAGAAADAVEEVLTVKLNPVSDGNAVYGGVNALIGCADGSCTLGTRIADGVDAVKGWFTW